MPTHYEGKPKEVLALDTLIKLTRANLALDARLSERGTLGSLTPSQFGVLETLYHLGPLCQGELSRKLLKSSGNMTLVLDNLEKQGLVQRVRSLEDRRMISIELLPAGKALIERIFPLHAAAVAEEMSVLSADEQVELGRLLRKLGRGTNDAPIRSAALSREEPLEASTTGDEGIDPAGFIPALEPAS